MVRRIVIHGSQRPFPPVPMPFSGHPAPVSAHPVLVSASRARAPSPRPCPAPLSNEPREHRDDARRKRYDLFFILHASSSDEDSDFDRRADFRGFATRYCVGARFVRASDACCTLSDVEARPFRGARRLVTKFRIAYLRVAHADEQLARNVKHMEGMMRKRASGMGSGHAHSSRRRRAGGTS
jgi:hypothetical protein